MKTPINPEMYHYGPDVWEKVDVCLAAGYMIFPICILPVNLIIGSGVIKITHRVVPNLSRTPNIIFPKKERYVKGAECGSDKMSAIKIKNGVRIVQIPFPMLRVMKIVLCVWGKYRFDPVITSGSERAKERLENSLHYKHLAYDFRIWGLSPDDQSNVRYDLKCLLGPDYDVVLEATHIHVEYDPVQKNSKRSSIEGISI